MAGDVDSFFAPELAGPVRLLWEQRRLAVPLASVALAALAQLSLSRPSGLAAGLVLYGLAAVLLLVALRNHRREPDWEPVAAARAEGRRRHWRLGGLLPLALGVLLYASSLTYFLRAAYTYDALLLWTLGVILVGYGLLRLGREKGIRNREYGSPAVTKRELLVLGLVLALALFLRLYGLEALPSGLNEDEAPSILDAAGVLAGVQQTPFGSGHWSTSFAFHFITAGLLALGLEGFWAIKLISVVAGTLAAFFLYLLARRAFGPRVALLAAFLLAVSSWQVLISRYGYLIAIQLVPEIAGLYFYLRGLQTGQRGSLIAAGAFFGAAMLLTQPVSLTPAVAFLLLAHWAIARRCWCWQTLFWGLVPFGVALLVFVPRGAYIVQNPTTALARANEVSLFNPQQWQDKKTRPWDEVRGNLADVALMFNYRSGHDPRLNVLPGQPTLDFVQAAALVLGFVYSLFRLRRPGPFLLLAIAVVMVLPSALALALDDRPSGWRAIGLVPAVYVYAALGLCRLGEMLEGDRGRWRLVAAGGIALALAASAWLNYDAYFVRFAHSRAAWYFTGPIETNLARQINRLSADHVVYVSADAASQSTVRAMTTRRAPFNMLSSADDLPVGGPLTRDLAFILALSPARWGWAGQASLLPLLRYYYPYGTYREFHALEGERLFATFTVNRAMALAARGLRARYYAGADWTGEPLLARQEASLDLVWPAEGLPAGPFASQWDGALFVPAFGRYALGVEGAGESEVLLDGKPVLAGRGGYQETVVEVYRGQHPLRVSFRTAAPEGRFALYWFPAGQPRQVVPPENLASLAPPRERGLLASYYAQPQPLGAPAFARLEPTIYAYWPLPGEPLPGPALCMQWKGKIDIPRPGSYYFETMSAGASFVYVDGRRVVDNGGDHPAQYRGGHVDLIAGLHDLRVDYLPAASQSRIIWLLWQPPGGQKIVIPSAALRPAER